MKPWLERFAIDAVVLLGIAAVGGFLVAASGIIPIKASSGHWPITAWILQFGKERSVATHTLGMDVGELEEPWLVLKGAGHYETGCQPCHGSPSLKAPRIAAALTPHPPYLPPLVDELSEEELFYIVLHGIKFTGMPAWPALERDDEVRAVVAFLLAMPTLDADGYQQLVYGDTRTRDVAGDAPRAVAESCARCHGTYGEGRGNAAFPKLAGQHREYLLAALDAYAAGERHSGIMEPLAARLEPHERRELADYYSKLERQRATDAAKERNGAARASIARGEQIASLGAPMQGVPSCMDCHGPGAHRRNAAYPDLAGQYADYLVLQLELFEQEQRGGSPFAHIMRHVATRLTREQMRDVAEFYAALPAREEGRR